MLSIRIPQSGLSSESMPFERALAQRLQGKDPTFYRRTYAPQADVIETGDHLVVRLEMPGLLASDINIHLEKDVLTISAERVAPAGKEGQVYHRSELAYGIFTRAFSLPATVVRDRIEASYENGMLVVTMPKAEEAKPKTIQVKVG